MLLAVPVVTAVAHAVNAVGQRARRAASVAKLVGEPVVLQQPRPLR